MDSIKKGIPKKDVKDISTNNEKPKIMSSIEILKMGSGDTSNNNPYEKVPLGNIKVGEGNEEETESIDLTDEEESEEIEKIEVEEAEELEEEIEKQIPTEGLLDIKELDFTRIATTAKDAKNGNFIKVGHPEYWGDSGELNYKIVDGAVYIYEGETILGFTDLQGIGNKLTEKIEKIQTEEIEEEPVIEEESSEEPPIEEIEEPTPTEEVEPIKNPIPEVESTIINGAEDDGYISKAKYDAIKEVADMYDLTIDELDILYGTIMHEAGPGNGSTELAAVTSAIYNRMTNSSAWNSEPNPYSIISRPGQFESFLKGRYKKYLNFNMSEEDVKVISDILTGKVSPIHNYQSFRSHASTGYSNNMFTPGGNRYGKPL